MLPGCSNNIQSYPNLSYFLSKIKKTKLKTKLKTTINEFCNVYCKVDITACANSPILLSLSLSEGWWTGVELVVESPLTTWPRAGLQELEGTWPSAPLEAEQEPDLGPKSVPFTVLEDKIQEISSFYFLIQIWIAHENKQLCATSLPPWPSDLSYNTELIVL